MRTRHDAILRLFRFVDENRERLEKIYDFELYNVWDYAYDLNDDPKIKAYGVYFTENQRDDMFNSFCFDCYDFFEEECRMYGIEDTFYLSYGCSGNYLNKEIYNATHSNGRLDVYDLYTEITDSYMCDNSDATLTDNGEIWMYDDTYIDNGEYECEKVYEWIDNTERLFKLYNAFMDRAVEDFKAFVYENYMYDAFEDNENIKRYLYERNLIDFLAYDLDCVQKIILSKLPNKTARLYLKTLNGEEILYGTENEHTFANTCS